MRTAFLILLLLSTSCTTGLERDGQCLASLTPDFLEAHTQLTGLQTAWRVLSSQRGSSRGPGQVPEALDLHGHHRQVAQRELGLARARYQRLVDWYDRVYQRVRTRIEEREMLTEAFWALAPGPGLLFYPIVRWNLHTVIWDGTDPDAESDPIRQYCQMAGTGRLQNGAR
jgi:hypothetical protein